MKRLKEKSSIVQKLALAAVVGTLEGQPIRAHNLNESRAFESC